MRGNSFAMGNSMANGPAGFRTWQSGWQAPRPVTWWDYMEGRDPA